MRVQELSMHCGVCVLWKVRVQEYQCSMGCVHSINSGSWRVQEYQCSVGCVHSINSGSWRVQEYQCSMGCAFYKQW